MEREPPCEKRRRENNMETKKREKLRYRIGNLWSNWMSFDAMKIPDNVDAVQVEEQMTEDEVKKHFPNYDPARPITWTI
jgi:ABC-type transporter Mla maintaining outer membrane lipid asymmetry ATPase subunit MlaF